MNLTSHSAYLKVKLKNPQLKEEFDKLDSEYELIRKILEQRIKRKMTQAQLAKKLGTTQSVVARLESGAANPSFKLLNRLALAFDTKLKISFV